MLQDESDAKSKQLSSQREEILALRKALKHKGKRKEHTLKRKGSASAVPQPYPTCDPTLTLSPHHDSAASTTTEHDHSPQHLPTSEDTSDPDLTSRSEPTVLPDMHDNTSDMEESCSRLTSDVAPEQ